MRLLKARIAVVTALIAGVGLLAPGQAQAADNTDCAFWLTSWGTRPAATAPNAKVPKFDVRLPDSMALGRRYGFTLSVAPTDADGHLYLGFGNDGASMRESTFADALYAKVIDGKVLDANGRPVDVPMLRVHPNLIDPQTWSLPVYLWSAFRDSATGQYLCKKKRVTITR